MPSGPNPQMFIPRKNWGMELDRVLPDLKGKGLQDELANYLHIQDRYNVHTHPATGGSEFTITVTASNALHPDRGDFQATGTCDDVTINAALVALPAGGGRVQLSEGTFNICNPIVIPKSAVTLEGVGPGTVLKMTAAANCITASVSFQNIHLTNFGCNGNGFAGTIKLNSGLNLIDNLNMTGGTGSAIQLAVGGPFISDSIIANNNIGQYPTAVEVERSFGVVIGNNIFTCDGRQVRLTGSSGVGSRVVVAGNQIQGGDQGISLEGGATGMYVIDANLVTGCAGVGIGTFGIVATRTIPALVCGNIVWNCTNSGIEIDDVNGFQIFNNYSFANHADGIRLDGGGGPTCDNNTVMGNRCRANTGWGINVNNAACNTNVVVGNDLRANTAGALQDNGTGTIKLYPAGANGDNFP